MKRRRALMAVLTLLTASALLFAAGGPAMAAKKGSKFYYKQGTKKIAIATYTGKTTVSYKPVKDSNKNYRYLNALLAKKGKLKIKIKKAKFKINGPLIPTSNKTIDATGSTITMKKGSWVMMTNPKKKIKNLTVIGGKWRSADKGGRKGSMFQLAFASNVVLDGVDVEANLDGHSIEIIACNNVTVKNCKVRGIGTSKKGNTAKEEQIQIDLSTPTTAPRVADFGKKWVQGQACSNIYILNNEVYGARAMGVNYHKTHPSSYHRNIVIRGNKLHSGTSEGIQFYNVIGGEISGNIVRTDATQTTSNSAYTIGVHLQNNSATTAEMRASAITVKDNVIYGNRAGVYAKGYYTNNEAECPGRFGTVRIENNTIYCKRGAEDAIGTPRGVKSYEEGKWIVQGNQTYDWTSAVTPAIDLR